MWPLKRALLVAGVVGLIASGTGTAAAGPLLPSSSSSSSSSSSHVGVLPDGAVWKAEVPSNWNGTLLLFSHGFGPNVPDVAPQAEGSEQDLLDRGYALAGSSYDPVGPLWALNSAVRDQFQTLDAVERTVLPAPPQRVIAVGESMGGLVSSLENEQSQGQLDGVLTTCGLVAGGVSLENYQLDGSHVINTLLTPDQPIQLAGYESVAQALLAAGQLQAAAQLAQHTAEGRARLALASAFYNVTTRGADGQPTDDYNAQQQAQFDTQYALGSIVLPVTQTGRWSIEQAVGGQPSWNVGVDYAESLSKSQFKAQVEALYEEAGLDLDADLRTLTENADITADPAALDNLIDTSVPTGRLEVPQLNIHTIPDELVPVEHENSYRRNVDAAGSGELLRQAYVARSGHCNFTSGEIIAAVHALEQRIDSGEWGDVTDPESLQAAATALDRGDAAYVDFEPEALTGTQGRASPRRS